MIAELATFPCHNNPTFQSSDHFPHWSYALKPRAGQQPKLPHIGDFTDLSVLKENWHLHFLVSHPMVENEAR